MMMSVVEHSKALRNIILAVSLLHVLLIVWVWIAVPAVTLPSKKEKLLVKTVPLSRPSPPVASPPAPSAKKSAAAAEVKPEAPAPVAKQEVAPTVAAAVVEPVKPAPQPAKKETVAKKVVAAAPVAKPAPSVTKAPSVNNASLEKAKAALDQATRQKTGATKASSQAVSMPNVGPKPLQLDVAVAVGMEALGSVSAGEASYRDELAQRLRLFLRLPKYGAVKVKLTLKSNGQVAKLEILSAAHPENKEYIEKNLPRLTFAPFGAHFSQPEHTFFITLTDKD